MSWPKGAEHAEAARARATCGYRRLQSRIRAKADITQHFAPVAQLDRVPGYEPGGRGFESCRRAKFCSEIHGVGSFPGKLSLH